MPSPSKTEALFERLRSLPADQLAEVADFVEHLRRRSEERGAREAVARVSEPAFDRVWDNADDAEYDKL